MGRESARKGIPKKVFYSSLSYRMNKESPKDRLGGEVLIKRTRYAKL